MRLQLPMILIILSCLLVSRPGPAPARESQKPHAKTEEARKQIDLAWHALDRDMRIKDLDLALAHLSKARALEPDNVSVLVEFSNDSFFRGHQTPEEKMELRKHYFQQGLEAARHALSIKECAGAHYWYAMNLGSLNADASILGMTSIFSELSEHVDWVAAHDPDYRYGIVSRFWIGVMANAPPMVMRLMGRDQEEIYADLQRSIVREPRFLENYVSKAEYLHYLEQNDQALHVLDQVLNMSPDALAEERAQNMFAQRRARKLWSAWTGLAYPNRKGN